MIVAYSVIVLQVLFPFLLSITWKYKSCQVTISCFFGRYEIHFQDFEEHFTGIFILSPCPFPNFQYSQSSKYISTLQNFKISKSHNFKFFKFSKLWNHICKKSKNQRFQFQKKKTLNTHKVRCTDLPNLQSFRFSDMKKNYQGCSHRFLYFWKYFGDKYGSEGPYLVDALEVPEII